MLHSHPRLAKAKKKVNRLYSTNNNNGKYQTMQMRTKTNIIAESNGKTYVHVDFQHIVNEIAR